MSVHQTPHGTWKVCWYSGSGNARRQRSQTFKTKREANRFDREIRAKKEKGAGIRLLRDAPTIREFSADWLAGKKDIADSTLESYIGCLERHILPQLGDLRVHPSDIGPKVLTDWVTEREAAGVGSPVIRRSFSVLRQILREAVASHELLEVNPIKEVRCPKPGIANHRYLDAGGVERLRSQFLEADDFWSAGFTSVLGYVGIRPQDALALRWSDVGEGLTVHRKNVDGEIVLGSKTGLHHRRVVELPPAVANDLKALKARSDGPTRGTDLIFPRPDHMPLRKADYDNWRKRKFGAAVRASGVDLNRPYDLRHTCASLLAAAGKNHLEIAHQLGNKPATAVRFYQHLIELEGGGRISLDEQIERARSGLEG